MGQLRAAVPAGGGPLSGRLRAARLLLALLIALAAAPPVAHGQAESPAELSEATVVEREGAAEVWVRLSRPTKYQAELMDNPWRLVLDFDDTAYRWTARPQPVEADPVRELRGSQYRKGMARLVIELRRKAAYVVEQDREGLRIVLPREAALSAAAPPRPAPARSTSGGPLVYGIVVLDAQRHAYIFDPGTQQVRRYAVGDEVGGAVVETIGERTVVLKTSTGRVELRVAEGRSQPAPPVRPR